MVNIVVWGAGNNCKVVLEAIKRDKCNILGIVDSDRERQNTLYSNGMMIYAPEDLINDSIDYVVISVYCYEEITQQCKKMGIAEDKIVEYWKSDKGYEFIDINTRKIYDLEESLEKCRRHLNNIPYEMGMRQVPQIRSAKELLELIIKEKKSLSRFGDGELEVMQGRERPWFQEVDSRLAERLEDVLHGEDERVIIALADNFGNLEKYTQEAADAIRLYLDNGIRDKVMKSIDLNRTYYDAYVTRPYFMYRDKKYAEQIFELFKQVWKQRDILLVEGSLSCIGIRNDLFEGAGCVRRIIAPPKNAFSAYGQILASVKRNAAADTLVLVSLGPTATVLAYDIALEGIQALDIGQLDSEYEWYLRGTGERVEIMGKCVAELRSCHNVELIADEEYEKQIIERIEI